MDDRGSVIIVGVLFGILNAAVTIYISMKTGMAYGLVLLLLFLSFFIFQLTHSVKPRTFLYLLAIITGSQSAVIAYTDGLGAIILSREPFILPDYVLVALMSISCIIGMLMSFYFMDYFLKGNFSWPLSRVNASIVTMLSAEKKDEGFRTSGLRMGASGFLSGALALLKGIGILPEVIGTSTAGIGISPMMIGVGMIVGIKNCIQIGVGALASLAILLLLEGVGTDYTTHLYNPWVFSTAISMLITTAFISLFVILKPIFAGLKIKMPTKNSHTNPIARDGGNNKHRWLQGTTLPLLVFIMMAALLLQYSVGVPAWIFMICIPITVIFEIIETRGMAELSMTAGISSFIMLLLIGLVFKDILPLLVLEGSVLAIVMSFTLTLALFKTAEYLKIDIKGMAVMLAIGFTTGGLVCIPIIRYLNNIYGIGTEALPAPYSVMWLEMAHSAVTGVISPSFNIYPIITGIAIALAMSRYKISAVSVALGLLLPVSIIATICLGGIIQWYLNMKDYLKDDNRMTASGLIAGDTLMSLIISLRYLL